MNNYRVLFNPAIEKSVLITFSKEASSVEDARLILKSIAHYTLFLHRNGLMTDYSNFGVIEEFIDGEWCEIDDDE